MPEHDLKRLPGIEDCHFNVLKCLVKGTNVTLNGMEFMHFIKGRKYETEEFIIEPLETGIFVKFQDSVLHLGPLDMVVTGALAKYAYRADNLDLVHQKYADDVFVATSALALKSLSKKR